MLLQQKYGLIQQHNMMYINKYLHSSFRFAHLNYRKKEKKTEEKKIICIISYINFKCCKKKEIFTFKGVFHAVSSHTHRSMFTQCGKLAFFRSLSINFMRH